MTEPTITDGDRLLFAIDKTARYIVELDLPDLEEFDRESLIGHLTGAIFVVVNDLLPLHPTRSPGDRAASAAHWLAAEVRPDERSPGDTR